MLIIDVIGSQNDGNHIKKNDNKRKNIQIKIARCDIYYNLFL